MSARSEFWRGAADTIPLMIGAAPFGLIFGTLATAQGVVLWTTLALSAVVFAGASQFIAITLIAGGAGVVVIIFTTLIVNLRHALYAMTLAPHLRHVSERWRIAIGFLLTDESFAVVSRHYDTPSDPTHKHWYALGSGLAMYLNWQAWTIIGVAAGGALPDAAGLGLDFALIVTFIGMLVPSLTRRPLLAAALAGGLAATALQGLPNRLGLLLAIVIGVAVGMVFDARSTAPDAEGAAEHG